MAFTPTTPIVLITGDENLSFSTAHEIRDHFLLTSPAWENQQEALLRTAVFGPLYVEINPYREEIYGVRELLFERSRAELIREYRQAKQDI